MATLPASSSRRGSALRGLHLALALTGALPAQAPTGDQLVRAVTTGTSTDLDAYNAAHFGSADAQPFSLPPGKLFKELLGVAIAPGTDHCYYWFRDGTVSEGTTRNPDHHGAPQSFSMPPNKLRRQIVGIAIAGSSSHCYVWLDDGTTCSGTSRDLDRYIAPRPYTLPQGKQPGDVIGVAIAKSNDRVYAYYRDGTRSVGTSTDLGQYQDPRPFSLPSPLSSRDVVGVGIASDDHVYLWAMNLDSGVAAAKLRNDVDELALGFLRDHKVPGLSVAVSKGGRVVLAKGYGYRDTGNDLRMRTDSQVPIGSVSKVMGAIGWMRLCQLQAGLSEDTKVYGPGGVLQGGLYTAGMLWGIARHNPIVGIAIRSNDRVVAWYGDGTYSRGTSFDLDHYAAAQPFDTAPSQNPTTIAAMAIAKSTNRVYTWYDDGSLSCGTHSDLDAYWHLQAGKDDPRYALPSGYSRQNIVGIGIAGSNDHCYCWFDDGTVCSGTSTDLDYYFGPEASSVAPAKSSYLVRGVAIAGSDDHCYVWYSDNTASSGTSTDLDRYSAPYGYLVAAGAQGGADWWKRYSRITVAHLMTHTAGFDGSGDNLGTCHLFAPLFGWPPGTCAAFEDVLNYLLPYGLVHTHFLATRKLLSEPGTRRAYSNHGMGLMGHLIHTASGKPYHQWMAQHVLAPAGVSGIQPILLNEPFVKHSYSNFASGEIESETLPAMHMVSNGLAAGGWLASAGQFVKLLLAVDRLHNHPDILPPIEVLKMELPYFAGNGVLTSGLGWKVAKDGGNVRIYHDGARADGTAFVHRYLPGFSLGGLDYSNITVAVFANIDLESGSLPTLATDIAKIAAAKELSSTYDEFGSID